MHTSEEPVRNSGRGYRTVAEMVTEKLSEYLEFLKHGFITTACGPHSHAGIDSQLLAVHCLALERTTLHPQRMEAGRQLGSVEGEDGRVGANKGGYG